MLSDAKRTALASTFRSVVFLLQGGCSLSSSVGTLTNWLASFDVWYRSVLRIGEAQANNHYLYNRCSSFYLEGSATVPGLLHDMFLVCQQRGFSVEVRIPLSYIGQAKATAVGLLPNFPATVVLDDRTDSGTSGAALAVLIDQLVDCGHSIIFAGPVQMWSRLGVLEKASLSACGFRILPSSIRNQAFSPSDPCHQRFRLFISKKGYIYPCAGLIDIECHALGHVKDPLDTFLLGGMRAEILLALAKCGPTLDPHQERLDFQAIDSLPTVCHFHRVQELNIAHSGLKAAGSLIDSA